MFSTKVPFPGAIHELPLLCSIEQPIHPEVLQEGNEFRGVDGVFTHTKEVSIAGAIGTSETGDCPCGYFLQRISQLTFQGFACPDRQGEVNFGISPEVVDVPEESFPFPLVPLQTLSQIFQGGPRV